jgi:hypothetical protein
VGGGGGGGEEKRGVVVRRKREEKRMEGRRNDVCRNERQRNCKWTLERSRMIKKEDLITYEVINQRSRFFLTQ